MAYSPGSFGACTTQVSTTIWPNVPHASNQRSCTSNAGDTRCHDFKHMCLFFKFGGNRISHLVLPGTHSIAFLSFLWPSPRNTSSSSVKFSVFLQRALTMQSTRRPSHAPTARGLMDVGVWFPVFSTQSPLVACLTTPALST